MKIQLRLFNSRYDAYGVLSDYRRCDFSLCFIRNSHVESTAHTRTYLPIMIVIMLVYSIMMLRYFGLSSILNSKWQMALDQRSDFLCNKFVCETRMLKSSRRWRYYWPGDIIFTLRLCIEFCVGSLKRFTS